MFVTMAELIVKKVEETRVTLEVAGLTNPVALTVRRYEGKAMVNIPFALKDKLGATQYDALKAVLRPHLGHVEMRTEADPRFVRAARARAAA